MFKIIRSGRAKAQNIQLCNSSGTAKGKMPPELTKETDLTSKSEISKLASKDDLKWRTPWHQKETSHFDALRAFYSEENNTDIIKLLQSRFSLTPSAIKEWWAKKKETKIEVTQQYIPERNQMLGNELAAAHFIVFRGGSVKFYGENSWIKADDFGNYKLPNRYQPDMYLQAIDCTDMELRYEGLSNVRELKQVEWFSINGCEKMDDWCMDRITNIFSDTLLYLDIRDCPNITHRGLGAIAKMSKLKILYVDDILQSDEYEMTCLMLQNVNTTLDIRTD